MGILKATIGLLLWLVCLAIVLGFAGALHPAGDSLSLLRVPLGLICLVAVLVPWRRQLRLALLASATAVFATTLPPLFASAAPGSLTVYSKNLWYRNSELPALAADIIASGAEVVMLQEVSRRNDAILGTLRPAFPHQHVCRFSGWSAIAVLSVHPISDTACSSRRAVAAARIERDGRAIWAASVHLDWPFPYANADAADAAATVLERLEGPTIVAGDFNIFPWAASVQRLQRASGTQVAGPVRPTYSLRGVPLLLDHIHAPGGGQVRYRPLLGSDHYGIVGLVNISP